MIVEAGYLLLLFSACYAIWGGVASLWFKKRHLLISLCVRLVFIAASLSLLALVYAFVTNDFTVVYVASNSNITLPWYYRITALWGSHEGSMLLWFWVLCAWALVFEIKFSRVEALKTPALGIMFIIQAAFGLFVALGSSPFDRQFFPLIKEGMDLNPLLQDFGFIVHPPILYLGYVGLSVPFALAAGTFIARISPKKVIPHIYKWALAPTAFLTVGITLGSWWAYYELGWGGWWFWDPVENAALIPWLVGISLIHASKAAQIRSNYAKFVYWLSFLGFAFSMLGTFLVRSGIVSSVHSFASDPKRGVVLLMFLATSLVFMFLCMRKFSLVDDSMHSKITHKEKVYTLALSTNSVLFFISSLVVILATIYPLVTESFMQKTVSIGMPYFNQTVVPIWGLAALVLGAYPFLLNKPTARQAVMYASILLTVLLVGGLMDGLGLMLTLALAGFIILGIVYQGMRWVSLDTLKKKGPALVSHLGIAVFILGIGLNSLYSKETNISLKKGGEVILDNWTFYLADERVIDTEHSTHFIADFVVKSNRLGPYFLSPEKQFFKTRQITMTETAISPGFFQDVYLALGDRRPSGEWACRLYLKPFVRWIWLGALMMAAGLFLSSLSRRKDVTT